MGQQVYLYADDTALRGCDIYRTINAQNTGVVAKATPGKVFGWHISNVNAAARFVKLYNKATAADENDTPLLTIPIPATNIAQMSVPAGISFSAGISIRAVTTVADNGNTGSTANDIVVNLFYK